MLVYVEWSHGSVYLLTMIQSYKVWLFVPSVFSEIYTSEKQGCDNTGKGTVDSPLRTVLQALIRLHGKVEADTRIWVDGAGDEKWDLVSKTKLKKTMKIYTAEMKKAEKEKATKEVVILMFSFG